MFQAILVPLDGSHFGEHALPWAVTIAKRSKAPLRLVHVHPHATEIMLEASPFYDEELKSKLKTRQRAYLDALCERLKPLLKTPVEVLVDEGDIAEKIRQQVQQTGTDLVVMAGHARGKIERMFLGSVTDELIRTLSIPVLIVHPLAEQADPAAEQSVKHILAPLDGSPFAEQVLEPTAKLAKLFKADLTLLRVVPPLPLIEPAVAGAYPPTMESMLNRLEDTQKQLMEQAKSSLEQVADKYRAQVKNIQVRVVENVAADEILQAAVPPGCDLVAVATHGRRGLVRMVLGSVSDKVIRGSQVPVLVVRPQDKK